MLKQLFSRNFSAPAIKIGRKQTRFALSQRICIASAAAVISLAVINNSGGLTSCDAAANSRIPISRAVKDPMLLERLRPATNEYDRIDEFYLSKEENYSWLRDHAIHGTLNKESGIEVYEIYKCTSADELLCIIKFGSSLNGYPGVVHGGITGLMFDNSFGWLLLSSKAPPAVTANLNINYRKPILPNTYAVLKAKFVETEERKIYLSATLHDSSGVLLADCTALFVKLRYTAVIALNIQKFLKYLNLQ